MLLNSCSYCMAAKLCTFIFSLSIRCQNNELTTKLCSTRWCNRYLYEQIILSSWHTYSFSLILQYISNYKLRVNHVRNVNNVYKAEQLPNIYLAENRHLKFRKPCWYLEKHAGHPYTNLRVNTYNDFNV